jgi:hypothetical protein
MDHTFHKTICSVLNGNNGDLSPDRFIWDQACGGSQWVSLFRGVARSASERYVCVDAVLVVGGYLRLILEIEERSENGFLPTRICGKLTAAALTRGFIEPSGKQALTFGTQVTFVQIVNTAGLKQRSRKLTQYRNIENDVRERLIPLGPITEYRLIAGDSDDFMFGQAGDALQGVVKSSLLP